MSEAGQERLRLGRESVLVALGSLALALAALRARPSWLRGVIGEGDAWQNVWNLDHVSRWISRSEPFFSTDRLWAPEGASLLAHTLSPTNTLPGALLAGIGNLFFSYNTLVVLSYVLAAVAIYRLARRMGAAPWGAALGALVFAFNPQRSARALGHLNLLGTGWIAVTLEAFWVATRPGTRRRYVAAVVAGLALAALAWCDWYLAFCGVLACACFLLFELVRGDWKRTLAVDAVAVAVSVACVGPYALSLARASRDQAIQGHPAEWCGTACTSLLVPSRIQLVSALTRPLTERNHQNRAEGAGYLGFVPLAAAAWVAWGRRRDRSLDPFLAAGGLGVLLALGPRLRVFDRLLDVPLPYALAEWLLPPLRVGGCPNRYVALAYLPLALGVALAATRLLSRGKRALVAAGALAIAIEYAPVDPKVSLWPWLPADPAMEAIAASPTPGIVLDLDRTTPALVRQLRHGRPQLLGYLSRTPAAAFERRLQDPVLGPLLDPERPWPRASRALCAALLRDRWKVGFVVADAGSPATARAERLGFPLLAGSEGRSVAWVVPSSHLAPLAIVDFGSDDVLTWSLAPHLAPEAGFLAPVPPGDWILRLAAATPTRVTVRWGAGRALVRTIDGPADLALTVGKADLAPEGTLLVRIESDPFAGADGPALLAFLPR